VDLDGHVGWFCLPFSGTPTEDAWLELLVRLVRLHEEQPIALLVIDSLANLSPMRIENDAVEMLRPLKPLRRLTERGVSVLNVHHPKKGATLPGQAAGRRGRAAAVAGAGDVPRREAAGGAAGAVSPRGAGVQRAAGLVDHHA
jgi:hypothetical protein